MFLFKKNCNSLRSCFAAKQQLLRSSKIWLRFLAVVPPQTMRLYLVWLKQCMASSFCCGFIFDVLDSFLYLRLTFAFALLQQSGTIEQFENRTFLVKGNKTDSSTTPLYLYNLNKTRKYSNNYSNANSTSK